MTFLISFYTMHGQLVRIFIFVVREFFIEKNMYFYYFYFA